MARDLKPRRWPQELVLLTVVYMVYRQTRIAVTGSAASALAHARQIISVERALGIYVEERAQRLVLDHPGLLHACNFYYGTIHFVVPAVALLLLFLRRPERYLQWRNVFGWMLGLGLVIFAVYPLLPPHLLPSAVPAAGPAHGAPAVGGFSWSAENPYAAMPSFHVAWATWCTLALWPAVSHRLARVALVAYPAVTVVVVVVTGNHYLLDAVGGWLVLGVARGLEELRCRAVAGARDPRPPVEPVAATAPAAAGPALCPADGEPAR